MKMNTSAEVRNKYPKILGEVDIAIPDTWINLIDQMCREIVNFHNLFPEFEYTRCVQIKEKFGGLRFYVESEYPEVSQIIRKYEELSFELCQECGCTDCEVKPTTNWIMYLCQSCCTKLNKTFR